MELSAPKYEISALSLELKELGREKAWSNFKNRLPNSPEWAEVRSLISDFLGILRAKRAFAAARARKRGKKPRPERFQRVKLVDRPGICPLCRLPYKEHTGKVAARCRWRRYFQVVALDHHSKRTFEERRALTTPASATRRELGYRNRVARLQAALPPHYFKTHEREIKELCRLTPPRKGPLRSEYRRELGKMFPVSVVELFLGSNPGRKGIRS